MGLQSQPSNAQALEKMRSKLATSRPQNEVMQATAQIQRRKTLASIGGYLGLGGIILGLCFLIGLATYLEKAPPEIHTEKKIRTLPAPSQEKSLDEQALYWAYALYDWNKFVATYDLPREALVDSRKALQELNRILPQTSGKTQMTVLKYRGQTTRLK